MAIKSENPSNGIVRGLKHLITGNRIFQYIDEKIQPDIYSIVREFGQDLAWGC